MVENLHTEKYSIIPGLYYMLLGVSYTKVAYIFLMILTVMNITTTAAVVKNTFLFHFIKHLLDLHTLQKAHTVCFI